MKEQYSSLQIAGQEVRYAAFKPRDAAMRVQVVQIHPDDNTMAQGIDKALINRGISVVMTTLVDGASGKVYPSKTPEALAAQRFDEDVASTRMLGSDSLFSAMLPYDGRVTSHKSEIRAVVQGIIEEVKPDAIIVPHPFDPHPDHGAAFGIVSASHGIPIYSMDTLLGIDKKESPVYPTHYIPLSRGEQQAHALGFVAHRGQTQNRLPEEHMVINKVLAMPEVRGTELRERYGRRDVQYAGTLIYDASQHNGQDPIADAFGKDIFVRRR